ncbi:MAG: hypothetical protein IJW08_06035 [Lentisphaeria bacterium]|nr:hypothetical protein [Lentisphaeria bacterium]MBR7119943.1 hypothetical protein [Lentisphaeria bacterium]
MSEFCRKCLAGNEPEVKINQLAPPPEGCCIICWVRYGKFVPACKTLGELSVNNKGTKNEQ